MTTTVAVGNGAGSAGKSTLVVNWAALMGRDGLAVLVVDADAQASAGLGLGVDPPVGAPTLGDVLLKTASLADAVVTSPVPGVSVVPASRALDGQTQRLRAMPAPELRLRRALDQAAGFDVVLIDCPGSLDLMTGAALMAADAAVTVAFPTEKEIGGLPEWFAAVAAWADAADRPGLTCRAVVPCQVPPPNAGAIYTAGMDLLAQPGQAWSGLVTPAVRRSTKVPESFNLRRPVVDAFPQAAVADDYRAVAATLRETLV
jgi:chromosome partitioning protein